MSAATATAGAPGVIRCHIRWLPGTLRAAEHARQLVRAALGPWHPRVDDADVVVSELVSNAVRYSRSGWLPAGTVTVSVAQSPGRVVIRVRDQGGSLRPVTAPAAEWAESGRGLVLVSLMADDWGHHGDGAGRVTWCRLDVPGGSPDSPRPI